MSRALTVAVIGGGVTGLAAAHRLQELKRERSKNWQIELFENSARLGGVVETSRRGGFLLEKGPDSFLSEKPAAVDLCRRLGIEDRLIGTRSENRRSFVVRRGRLVPLPRGFYLVAPTRLWPFLGSPLFSWHAKARMLLEPCVPRRDDGDESVAAFVRRRFGRECLERVGQPMIAGIYTGDEERLSIDATFPAFRAFEREKGSVTRGLKERAARRSGVREAGGPRYSLFLSFRGGMGTLVDALESSLRDVSVFMRCPVRAVAAENRRWIVSPENGAPRKVDAVIVCLPAHTAAAVTADVSRELSQLLGSFEYESVVTLNLAYRRSELTRALDGFGFVVPKTEQQTLLACSFSSQKFEGRAPEGDVLLRAFIGGYHGRRALEQSDAELLRAAHAELAVFLGIRSEPLFSELHRHNRSMLQYPLNHRNRTRRIEEETLKLPGLFLAGALEHGPGIPDCVENGRRKAEHAADHLETLQ